jgi:spore coat polysaccharide biosynthesis protein SpsF (cytidylyltransferase family)
MAEKVVAVVEARMGSTRLPGKSMKVIGGAPLVEHVLRRIRMARSVHHVVLATTDSSKDDPLAHHVASIGFHVHRGSETDVLGRILEASKHHGATVHVQSWGDCPFVDPDEIDSVVGKLQESAADLVSNCVGGERRLPYGLDVIAVRVAALEAAERRTRDDPYHREHGTTFIYETTGAFRVERVHTPEDVAFPDLDLTINTDEDFRFVERVYAALLPVKPEFRLRDVIAFLHAHGELLNDKNKRALEGRC